MHDYNLGFKANELNVKLINRTFHNDSCTSFYFIKGGFYFILFLESDNISERECDSYKKFTLTEAENVGEGVDIELDASFIILETDCKQQLINFINKL